MSAKEVSAKTIKIHAILVFVVCILFGLISFVRKAFFMGLCTVGMGAVIPLVALVLMRNSSKIARGIFLTQAATVVIAVLSAAQGELHSMFALLAGNIAIGSIYYNLNNIKYAWILSDVILITACLFKDIVYVGADLSLIIKGILGLNIAALMVRILLKDCIDSLRSAEEARTEAAELLTQVRTQMAEGQKLTEQQNRTVREVAEIAKRLDRSSEEMLDISSNLSAAAEEQSCSITDIHNSIELFAKQTENCFTASDNAHNAAVRSVKLLEENSTTMGQMISAMDHLNETSARIGTIIKTIEDISFQTNILALNAAVEAARAGAAGKGFAVVADEVRNLAAKSADAAKNTAELITESIKGVKTSTEFAHAATGQIGEIVKCSAESEALAKRITALTHEQQQNVYEIKSRVDAISVTITSNTQTAAESAAIARSLSSEVEQMNAVVASR